MSRRHAWSTVLPILWMGLMATPHEATTQQEVVTQPTRAEAVHLLQRASYGPRLDDIERVLALGVDGWLDEQLHPEQIEDRSVDEVARRFPLTDRTIDELLEQFPPGMVLNPLRQLAQSDSLSDEERRRIRRELGRVAPGRILMDLAGARLYRSAFAERQLEEVMTAFWFDHFNVYFRKGATRWLVGDYERTAIRPHVFDSFENMLMATARHPAMLVYLDNFRSAAPDSSIVARRLRANASVDGGRGGRVRLEPRVRRPGGVPGGGVRPGGSAGGDPGRRARQAIERMRRQGLGLNENYARELLELHTLGVDGGYTQTDVVHVARAFTGWGFEGPGNREMMEAVRSRIESGNFHLPDLDFDGSYRFQFRPVLHDAGAKSILGETYPEGGLEDEGFRVLKALAAHPSTARHIATQLATRFVSDTPPEAIVEELTQVFLDTGGNLREVTRALFSSAHFFAEENHGGRVKSPVVLLASTLRLTGAQLRAPRGALEALRTLGEAPYLAEPPTGYAESSEGWADSGSLLNRMNLGLAVPRGSVSGIRLDPGPLMTQARERSDDMVGGLVELLLPDVDSSGLLEVIEAELGSEAPVSGSAWVEAALGLILGSPEFQRH